MPSLGAAAAIPVTGTPTTPNSSSTPCCFKQRATSLAPSISAMMDSYATSGFGPGASCSDWHTYASLIGRHSDKRTLLAHHTSDVCWMQLPAEKCILVNKPQRRRTCWDKIGGL